MRYTIGDNTHKNLSKYPWRGSNNAKLHNIQPKRAMLELKQDRITAWKKEYEKEGATPTNMRYGYVAGPVDHSLFA